MKPNCLQKNHLIIIVLATIAFFISSCGAVMHGYIKDDGSQMPPDFGREKAIILALKHGMKSYDKNLESYFQKYYTGEYILVTEDELKTAYADVNKYRYILDRSCSTYQVNSPKPGFPMHMTTMVTCSYQMKDRTNNGVYTTSVSSGAYTKVLKAYLQELEIARLKHESESLTSH